MVDSGIDTAVRRSADATYRPTAGPRHRPRQGLVNVLYLPALALLAMFTAYPLVNGVGLSFTDWDGYSPGHHLVGLENYQRLLSDGTFRTVFVNTLVYALGSTVLQQVLGLGLALALDRPMRGRALLRAIIYLPVLVSPVIMGTIYYLLLQYDNGALNDIVVALGGEQQAWLSTTTGSVAIIVAVNTIQFVGLSMIIYLAGLQSIPTMYYEAARLDGASGWSLFRRITVPLLQPAFATSIVLNLIGGMKLFDVIKVLTGGGPGYSTNSVSTFIGLTYFNAQSAGYAAAMGVALFAVIMIMTLVLNAALNKRRLEA
ncbi:carbohydrate ABC transporter permease [Micromonospora maritima]|uniref:carbohydrate ABC transporter permease n=1 Tax=Micromonospora maritima TaxID=986711 RepID=UPI001FE2DD18|nr:sugar ABC transporter permease [Micromonospora maritima]